MKNWLVLAVVISICPASLAFSSEERSALVEHARALLGVDYDLGGRLQKKRGVDCQGLIFFALERVHKCGWRSYSVMPRESIARAELGRPVRGLAPAMTKDFDPTLLQPGDIVYVLGPTPNPNEMALLPEPPQWVWHMGMATDEGKWIHADPYTGQVREHPLKDFLIAYRSTYSGVFVTRMTREPAPKTCRSKKRLMPARPTKKGPSTSK